MLVTLTVFFIHIIFLFFFFNDTATTEIYTLSLHDALPICRAGRTFPYVGPGNGPAASIPEPGRGPGAEGWRRRSSATRDRKSTRLNSSHANISYAVFCLKKNKRQTILNEQYTLHSRK